VRGFARVTIPFAYRYVLGKVRRGARVSIRGYRCILDWMRRVVRVTIPLTYRYILDRVRWGVQVLVPLMYPYFIIAVTALAALVPLSLVLYQSLLTAPFFESSPRLGLSAYRFVFADEYFNIAFRTTLLLAAGMMLIAVPLGAALAFVIVRTDIPGRHWIEPLILLPIFPPPLVLAFGYVEALGPAGILTATFNEWTGVAPWNVSSFPFLVAIAGLTHVPYVYLYAAAALRGLGGDAEETARSAGAGLLRVAFGVSLPMTMPAILFAAALVFFLGFQLFGLPLVLGDAQGPLVLSTYLYKLTNKLEAPPYQLMAAVTVIMVAISLPLLFMQRGLLNEAQRRISRRTKDFRFAPFKLGLTRWLIFLAIALWLAVTVLMPLAAITLRSFGIEGGRIGVLTLDHFRALLQDSTVTRSILNTIVIGLIGGATALGFYTAIALAAHRWRSAWAPAADYLALVPRAMPGLAAGLALLWLLLFFKPLTPLRQTLISVWLAYTLIWLAHGLQLVSSMLVRVDRQLEDVARTVGATEIRAKLDITLPLIRNGLLAGWLVIFIIFVREYSTGLYLLGPGTEVIGSLLVLLWGRGAIDLISALSVINVIIIGAGVFIAVGLGARLHAFDLAHR
jgi:iron(III) transport system permease protein